MEKYTYDGFDRVASHKQTKPDSTAETTRYVYDPFDRTVSGTEKAGGSGEEKSYTFGPWNDRLSIVNHDGDGGAKEFSYYSYNTHTDVELITKEDGKSRATYGYTAYGKDDIQIYTGIDKPDPANPDKKPDNTYRFNAKRVDPATGDYDMGARHHSPERNRFITRDMFNGALSDLSLGTDEFAMNRYAFTSGNPITGIEVDGHWCDGCNDGNGCPTEHGYLPSTLDATGRPQIDYNELKQSGVQLNQREFELFEYGSDEYRLSQLDPVEGYEPPVCDVICSGVRAVAAAALCGLATGPIGTQVCGFATFNASEADRHGEYPGIAALEGAAHGFVFGLTGRLLTARPFIAGGGPRGAWGTVTEPMSVRAAAYQKQITGAPVGAVYRLNGVKFDAFKNGVLQEAKGLGYANFIKSGEFVP